MMRRTADKLRGSFNAVRQRVGEIRLPDLAHRLGITADKRYSLGFINTLGAVMKDDETQIRELVSHWQSASKAGDVESVLALMSDDAVFLIAGRSPMGKQEFASLSRPPNGQSAPKTDSTSEIQELIVSGEWAFMRTALSVVVTPHGGGDAIEREGHTLTVLHKVNGKWLLARDANLLAPVPKKPYDA